MRINCCRLTAGGLLFATLLYLAGAQAAIAQPSAFADDFENGLSAWTGKGGGSHYGHVVPDPQNSANHCLSFTASDNSGDIFSASIPADAALTYILRFRFLGLSGSGGYIGVSAGLPGDHKWLSGTCWDNNILVLLVADGTWREYSIEFSPSTLFQPMASELRVMIEDWDGAASGYCPGATPDASFFDDVSLAPSGVVPADDSSWGFVKGLYR